MSNIIEDARRRAAAEEARTLASAEARRIELAEAESRNALLVAQQKATQEDNKRFNETFYEDAHKALVESGVNLVLSQVWNTTLHTNLNLKNIRFHSGEQRVGPQDYVYAVVNYREKQKIQDGFNVTEYSIKVAYHPDERLEICSSIGEPSITYREMNSVFLRRNEWTNESTLADTLEKAIKSPLITKYFEHDPAGPEFTHDETGIG